MTEQLGPLWCDGTSVGLFTSDDVTCRFTSDGITIDVVNAERVEMPWDDIASVRINGPRKHGVVWQIPYKAWISPRTTNDERPPTVHLQVNVRGGGQQTFILGRPSQAPFSFLESEVLDAALEHLNSHGGIRVLGDAAAMDVLIPRLRGCRSWITPLAWWRTRALLNEASPARTS